MKMSDKELAIEYFRLLLEVKDQEWFELQLTHGPNFTKLFLKAALFNGKISPVGRLHVERIGFPLIKEKLRAESDPLGDCGTSPPGAEVPQGHSAPEDSVGRRVHGDRLS
jgi:hypothetical protein